jgi:hypothetical protein
MELQAANVTVVVTLASAFLTFERISNIWNEANPCRLAKVWWFLHSSLEVLPTRTG